MRRAVAGERNKQKLFVSFFKKESAFFFEKRNKKLLLFVILCNRLGAARGFQGGQAGFERCNARLGGFLGGAGVRG